MNGIHPFPIRFSRSNPTLSAELPRTELTNELNQSPLSGSDLKRAWETPAVRERLQQCILTGILKEQPDLGKQFIQRIDQVCRTPMSNDGRFKELRRFYLQLTKDHPVDTSINAYQAQRIQRRIDQVTELLSGFRPRSFLDIGYGDGRITKGIQTALNLNDKQVIGIDVFNDPACPHPFEKIQFDGERLPIRDNAMDFVMASSVLHHAENYPKLVQELHRVVRPGGKVILREFDMHSEDLQRFHRTMDEIWYRVYLDLPEVPIPGHYYGYQKWADLFEKSGFAIEKTIYPEPDSPYLPFMVVLSKKKPGTP